MIRTCIVCGKEFDGYRTSKLCSEECRRIKRNSVRGRYEKGTRRANGLYDPNVYQARPCKYCGMMFVPIRVGQYTCASDDCRRARDREHHRGKFKAKAFKPVTKYQDFNDAENYASNQMTKTLANVPKIRIEL